MPHVNVTVIGNAPSQEQKSALFSKISNLLVTVLGPTRRLTLVSVRTEPATSRYACSLPSEQPHLRSDKKDPGDGD